MTWSPIVHPVDFAIVADKRTPGIAKFASAPVKKFKWERKTLRGVTGEYLIYNGEALSDFQIKCFLYDERDFDDWEVFKPTVDDPVLTQSFQSQGAASGSILTGFNTLKRPKAIEVWHPWLADRGISACVVESVSAPEDCDPTGVWCVTIGFIQWRPLKLSFASPAGSVKKPEVTDPVDREIDALAATLKRESAL